MKDSFVLRQYPISILLWPFGLYLVTFFAPISSKAHNNIFYIVVLTPFILWGEKNFIRELFSSRIGLVSVLLTGYLVFRSLVYLPFDSSQVVDHLRHLGSFYCFFYISVALFYKEKLVGLLAKISLWAAIWGAGSAVYFYSQHRFPVRMSFIGPVDHAILGASVYALFCLFLVYSKTPLVKRTALAAFPLLFSSILFSQSRGPLLSILCSVLMTAVVVRKKWMSGVMILFLGGFWLSHYQGWISFGRLFQATSSYRLSIWQQVFSDIWQEGSWLFGHSLSAEQAVTVGKHTFQHAHSGYVATFAQGGVVGLTLLLALVIFLGLHVGHSWGGG